MIQTQAFLYLQNTIYHKEDIVAEQDVGIVPMMLKNNGVLVGKLLLAKRQQHNKKQTTAALLIETQMYIIRF